MIEVVSSLRGLDDDPLEVRHHNDNVAHLR